MTSKPSDPLLGFAKLIVVITRIIIVVAAVGIGIGIGVLATVGRDEVYARIAKAGAPDAAMPLLLVGFALIFVLLQLAYRFFKELSGIIDTVGEGEPFDASNADRLSRMGWISVAAHGVGLVLAGFAAWFAPYLHRLDADSEMDFGIDGGGILLTLILFILARVFREGTRMREELEGTV